MREVEHDILFASFSGPETGKRKGVAQMIAIINITIIIIMTIIMITTMIIMMIIIIQWPRNG